jgi:pimeloyl-ACP methyl ester carboxylesterase
VRDAGAAQAATIATFELHIEQSRLDDLRQRLELTRFPDRELVDDWSQGAPLAHVQALVEHWKSGYDWRRCEKALNGYGQFLTSIDGVDIHFLHVRSKHPDALPMILTHGWPGSIVEFLQCIEPLTNPPDPRDAFHLVIPSLPGYGFSGKPREKGWNVARIGKAWAVLMQRLGYSRYVAQGGDWGAAVTTAMGKQRPEGLAAIHVNMPLVQPREAIKDPTPEETRTLEQLANYAKWENGYAAQQMTRPQTIGYALADSPAGQAAWVYEKFRGWSDVKDAPPESAFSRDALLDNIMLYWLGNAGASSARLYWESFRGGFRAVELHLPTGVSVFPKDIYTAPRIWCERCMHDLIYYNELDRGGHFAAFELPQVFVEELRKCFRKVRQ